MSVLDRSRTIHAEIFIYFDTNIELSTALDEILNKT